MSSIDFTKIRKKFPDSNKVWDVLEAWDEKRDPAKPIVVREMIHQLHDELSPTALIAAINAIVEDGVVEKSYRVLDPSMKVLLAEEYQERSEIPEMVRDNFDRGFAVLPESIRMILRPVKHE
jgi:hypothetical protein